MSTNNNNNNNEQPMLANNDNNTSTSSTSNTSPRLTTLNYLNLIAYILNIAITYGIGVGGGIGIVANLPTNGELSRKYQTLITPVGWAFAIWGIIFVAQAFWAVLLPLVWPTFRPKQIISVGYNYIGVCVMQIGWTVAFSTEMIWLSLVFMGLIGVFLWSIVLTNTQPVISSSSSSSAPAAAVESSRQEGEATSSLSSSSFLNYLVEKFPFTIHAGWITAAFLVNASVLLVDLGVSAQIQFYVAIVSLAVLLVVAFSMVAYQKKVDPVVIPLVLAWACWGIYQELSNTTDESILAKFTSSQIDVAKYGAVVCSGVIVALVVLQIAWTSFQNSRQRSRQEGTAEEATYLRAD